MRVNVNTAQITAFNQRLATLPASIKEAIRGANLKSAQDMVKRGRKIAPRSNDGPHIADTIKMVPGDPRLMEYTAEVGSAALYYAVPLEFGHIAADGSHVPANPFWVPLTRLVRKTHRSRVRRALRKALRAAFP